MSEFRGFRPHVKEIECRERGSLLDLVGSVGGDLSPLELIELGSVYVNDDRNLNPNREVKPGDRVRVHASPRRFPVPRDLAARIVEEHPDRFVVEKPIGFPSEPTVDNFKENLVVSVGDLRGQTLHLVNALEIDSSGLVMLAKSTLARDEWKRAFAEGRVRRRFSVFTETPLVIGDYDGIRVVSCEERVGATDVITEGRTSWRCAGESIVKFYRSELVSSSARPAQIRESLANRGSVVIGDAKNGSTRKLVDVETERAAIALLAISF